MSVWHSALTLAAVLLLAACQTAAPAGDSLASECPSAAAVAPLAGNTLADLQQQADQRLGALGLRAVWQAQPASAGEGRSFADSAADRQRLARLLAVLLPALERYPASLLQAMGVRDIVLLADLQVAGQRRLAMPAPEQDALFYADNGQALCSAGMELRVHHELYHLIEHRLFGDFYYRDPDWLALNPPGLQYGQGGASAYRTGFQNLGHPQPAMVSAYALYGPEEDKAELFGWLMTPGYAQRLARWAQADSALAAKRDFMRALLNRLSGGQMDSAYFARIASE